jgi:hypothetical protein
MKRKTQQANSKYKVIVFALAPMIPTLLKPQVGKNGKENAPTPTQKPKKTHQLKSSQTMELLLCLLHCTHP